MKRKLSFILFYIVSLFVWSDSVYALESSYYPETNIVTIVNEEVVLPDAITFLDESKSLKNDIVNWEKVSKNIFSTEGRYRVAGTTYFGKKKVYGNITVFSKDEKVKVAAVGDSITSGMKVENVSQNSYPKQLSYRLGSPYQVENFGHMGRTLLEHGNAPYIRSGQYKRSLNFEPNVVVIQLGTNDTKRNNFLKTKQFVSDYVRLINSYKELASKPIVYLCLPPQIFSKAYGINQGNLINLLPKIFEAAEKSNVSVGIIDNFSLTENSIALIPDGVHPNAKGASLIANNIYHSLSGKNEPIINQTNMEVYDSTHGAINSINNEELELVNINTGNWISYKDVNLLQSTKNVQLLAAVPLDKTKVTIRLGDLNGEIVGEKILVSTGNANSWAYHNVPINFNGENQNLCLIFERENTRASCEIIKLRKVNFNFDSSSLIEVKTFEELETAFSSNLTNIKVMNDITFKRNLQLKENTTIDLDTHTVALEGFYIGKDERVGQRIEFTLENGKMTGRNCVASIYSNNSRDVTRGMNLTFNNVEFDGTITHRNYLPDSTITLNGETQITSAISRVNTLIYKEVDLTEHKGHFQLFAAVPYDNTKVTIRKESPVGEVVGEQILARTGSVNTWAYHVLDITGVSSNETLYVNFERQGTGDYTEIVRLGKTDFNYDALSQLEK